MLYLLLIKANASELEPTPTKKELEEIEEVEETLRGRQTMQ